MTATAARRQWIWRAGRAGHGGGGEPVQPADLGSGAEQWLSTFIPDGGGWKQEPGEARVVTLPNTWGGRFWGRTGCTFDGSGRGSCETGDRRRAAAVQWLKRQDAGLAGRVSVRRLRQKDFYDVSLVDGYNLPIAVAAQAGTYTRSNPNSRSTTVGRRLAAAI